MDLSDLIQENRVKITVKNLQTGGLSGTSNGLFVKKNGLYYQNGLVLQGYPSNQPTLSAQHCVMEDLKAPDNIPPHATSYFAFPHLNLDAASPAPFTSFNPEDTASYNYIVSGFIFDKEGALHPFDIYFVKTSANKWDIYLYADHKKTAKSELEFNSSGALVSDPTFIFDYYSYETIAPQFISVSFKGTTQYALYSSSGGLLQDGRPSTSLIGELVDKNGYLIAYYGKNEQVIMGQIATYKP